MGAELIQDGVEVLVVAVPKDMPSKSDVLVIIEETLEEDNKFGAGFVEVVGLVVIVACLVETALTLCLVVAVMDLRSLHNNQCLKVLAIWYNHNQPNLNPTFPNLIC